jgi:hypothetical protein
VAEPAAPPLLSLEPVISWPREAVPGKKYLLTVDLRSAQTGDSWPFSEEEFEFSCILDAYPLFVSRPLDDPVLVVHRFGGTYRPVRFLLDAQEIGGEDVPDAIWLTLSTRWGVPVRTIKLTVRVIQAIQAGQQAPPVIELPLPLTEWPAPEAEPPVPAITWSRDPGARQAEYLRMTLVEYEGQGRWRWILADKDGEVIADHEVRLDTGCWQYEAFTDMRGYLQWHVAPDRRVQQETQIVREVGEWIGEYVLGPIAQAMLARAPATVVVTLPQVATSIAYAPLELAYVGAAPLVAHWINLIWQFNGDEHTHVPPVSDRLRVLGLFSLPEGGQPLNLRRERYALVRLLNGIAAEGRAVDVRVLQYGVTRDRLRDVLEEDEGWDVIHISGHGAPGVLLLEKPDGSPDVVAIGELADLLDVARERVKLVTISACWSAALSAADQRWLLGQPARMPEPLYVAAGSPDAGVLATELAGRLGCAVLAMRYPVVDDFAIDLTQRLYQLMFGSGRVLPRALSMALKQVSLDLPIPLVPALSMVTPALFGVRAVDLRLPAPRRVGPQSYDTSALKMAGFPAQPDRFVGRTGVMARASAALAARSGMPGVLLQGMPGIGKTACAVELAYTHEHAFDRLVWYTAPDEDMDISASLTHFTLSLEQGLPGFQMLHLLDDSAKLAGFLPRLTELMERRRVLIVLDHIESLITQGGQWRDERWGVVVGALCAHTGLGRVLLISRRLPASQTRLMEQVVDPLSPDEALLLARELPHLRDLIHGEPPGIAREVARILASGVLKAANGHPKLLELADGQVADPARLTALIETGDQAWRQSGDLPEGFFGTGESSATAQDYLQVLDAWTRVVSSGLAPGQRTLCWFLCGLEEHDRIRPVIDATWAALWTRLELPGQPPGLGESLAALAVQGLIVVRPENEESAESYGIHPAVSASCRAQAGPDFRAAADTELAEFWLAVARSAVGPGAEERNSELVVRAGLGAAPYLCRLQRWTQACMLLEFVLARSQSRAVVSAALPFLNAIATAITGTEDEPAIAVPLAIAQELVDAETGNRLMQAVLAGALDRQDNRIASVATGYLARYRMRVGPITEALGLAEQKAVYSLLAEAGAWAQLGDQVLQLQVLNVMGRGTDVLAKAQELRASAGALRAGADPAETVEAWSVRETLADANRRAAAALGRWTDALELNAAVVASMRDRAAPVYEVGRATFNDYFPLLQVDRLEEALSLLAECQNLFLRLSDMEMLGNVWSALAACEQWRGRDEEASALEQDALRYSYPTEDLFGIAVSHHNLGNYIRRKGDDTNLAAAHHLTAALLCSLTGMEGAAEATGALSEDLEVSRGRLAFPEGVLELSELLGEPLGPLLSRLVRAISSDPAETRRALDSIVAEAHMLAGRVENERTALLAAWEPFIQTMVTASSGDTAADSLVAARLAEYANSGWAPLAQALWRLRQGQYDLRKLTIGLDPVSSAIVRRAVELATSSVATSSETVQPTPATNILTIVDDSLPAAFGYGQRSRVSQMPLMETSDRSQLLLMPDRTPSAEVFLRR